MSREIVRGGIYYCKLPQRDENSRIQTGTRPCIVISNDKNNMFCDVIKVIPLTTKIKRTELPCHTIIKKTDENGLKEDSMALSEQTQSIDKVAILEKIGNLSYTDMYRVATSNLAQDGLLSTNNKIAIQLLHRALYTINNRLGQQA